MANINIFDLQPINSELFVELTPPRYLDYFQVDTPEDRAFYIVQQLAPGKSLADLVKSDWRTNESGVRRIATQVLETEI